MERVVEAAVSLSSEFRAVDMSGCTGYGHDEVGGHEALDQVFAEIFSSEAAIHMHSCYHLCFFALLRSGDELLAVAGAPYDTLEEVIGKRDSHGMGSLRDFGVEYREVPHAADGGLDWVAVTGALKPQTKCALIQRVFIHGRRVGVREIDRAMKIVKMQNPNCLAWWIAAMVNLWKGADLIAGSLIENPAGTIAPCGGYVARSEIKVVAAHLSAPGLGVDCGSTPGDIMQAFLQGLFLSPSDGWQSNQGTIYQLVICSILLYSSNNRVTFVLKGSFLIAEVMSSKGYVVQPLPWFPFHDTVQAVQLENREKLLPFCEAVQRSSLVASFTKLVAGFSPGYASEVIFADGTFIDGRTSELSCDGPLRGPFSGGTHWTQWGIVLGEVWKSI
ncbi:putative methionine gamma-lyase [Dillenia turbinata]|uniref:Methionine gamma-lyase n=1 Tax=Dillenia turbinata TaxID=194707 RepID=A0AAN8WDH7_9MAGN